MKKTGLLVSLFLIMINITTSVCAAIGTPDLKFTYEGNGTFIYENNIESITSDYLSDKSNPNPKYIMKNENLKPGKYSVFITNLNATGIKNEEGKITKPGFDMEIDGVFMTDDKAYIKITALGFEVPCINTVYANAQADEYEETWSCMNAWADYLDMPIYQKDNFRKYKNIGFTDKEFTINKDTNKWISEYIENYCAVPYLKPVNILMDFEIISGSADFNIAALKSNGVLRDRSNHDYSAPEAPFVRDRQYKGKANTLPKVNATLSFTVNKNDKPGTIYPVRIYNQYNCAGRVTDRWITNLNPQNDARARDICAQSDMIEITYEDETKSDLYGAAIGDKVKDDKWHFDVYHADNSKIDDTYNGKNTAKYTPNSQLDRYGNNNLNACNLGNYGVRVHYTVNVYNNSNYEKYFNYKQATGANDIVILYDKNHTPVNDYAVCKGNKADESEDVMASVKLLPNKKTTFYLEVILPANNNGGTQNFFELSDEEIYVGTDTRNIYEAVRENVKNTGKEFLKFEGENLFTSYDNETWTLVNLPKSAKDIFKNEGNNYKIIATDDGYIAKWGAYDGAPSYFEAVLDFYCKVYKFDKEFNLVSEMTFPKFPSYIGFCDGIYYVTAGENYYSYDFSNWLKLSTINPPVSNGKYSIASTKYGYFFIKIGDMPFVKLDYEGDMPRYVKSFKDIFYYTDFDKIYVSKSGLYWHELNAKEDIITICAVENGFLVNGHKKIDLPIIEDDIIIKFGDEIAVGKNKPYLKNGNLMICIKKLFENADIGYSVEEDGVLFSRMYDNIKVLKDKRLALLNGKEIPMTECFDITDGEIYLPLDFVKTAFGFSVNEMKDINFIELSY